MIVAPRQADRFDPDTGQANCASLELLDFVGILGEIPMSSFSCPHFDMQRDDCVRLQTDCVPGRPGCVLSKNSVFAVPVEERIRQKEEAKRRLREK